MSNYAQKFIANFDVFHTLLFAFLIKDLITPVSTSDVIVTVSLVALSSLKIFIQSKTPLKYQLDTQVQMELNELKAALNALKMERNIIPAKQKYF